MYRCSLVYSESWSGTGYFGALEELARVTPEWVHLLQSSLFRPLFGLKSEDFPSCGWISNEEIQQVLSTFIDARKETLNSTTTKARRQA